MDTKKRCIVFFRRYSNGDYIINSNVLPSADYEASRLILYENLGGENFKERRPFKNLRGRGMLTWDSNGFIVDDMNNDGLQDVIIGANLYHESLGSSNYVYMQKGGLLSFDDPIKIAGNPRILGSIKSVDINRDGYMDIVSPDVTPIIYINDGNGINFKRGNGIFFLGISFLKHLPLLW